MPASSRCIGCGKDNPHGLHLAFELSEEGSRAPWTPGENWEGYPGVTHGGIISTVLDESMSKAVNGRGWQAFTGEIRVRFRKQVRTGEPYTVRGWVVSRQKRRIELEASLCSAEGQEHAHAWATFLAP
jgi:acyl-coenzyme A thioesterase PaaI-like protein